jgi:flagellar motor component MotA
MTSGTEENVVVGGSPVANGNANNANAAANASALAEAQARIMAMPVADENTALNIMVSFLNIAQRRGVFSIDESAKIWECIKKFQKTT